MTFIKFTQLTPTELNYELTAQNVIAPLKTFQQGFGQEKAPMAERASPLETDWEMVSPSYFHPFIRDFRFHIQFIP